MATDYLEKYIDSVSDLPAQLQRKFRLIRDLDEKSAKLQVGQHTSVVASTVQPTCPQRSLLQCDQLTSMVSDHLLVRRTQCKAQSFPSCSSVSPSTTPCMHSCNTSTGLHDQ